MDNEERFLPLRKGYQRRISEIEIYSSEGEKVLNIMPPKQLWIMQNQKVKRYAALSNTLFLNYKVQYLARANALSEILEIYRSDRQNKNNILSKEELSENLRKITFAASVLTFENVRLMVLDMHGSNALILNLAEDTIIIGMNKDALLPDLAQIFSCLSKEIRAS